MLYIHLPHAPALLAATSVVYELRNSKPALFFLVAHSWSTSLDGRTAVWRSPMEPCACASACYGPLVSCPPDWRALMLPAVRTALISYRPTGRSLRIRPSCADVSMQMYVIYLGRESKAVDYSGSLISDRGKSRARFVLLIIPSLTQLSSTATSAAPRKLHRQRRGCSTRRQA